MEGSQASQGQAKIISLHCFAQYKGCSSKNNDCVIGLQETYITNPGKLPYLWRGNFDLTPGRGNSCGCVTLLSSHLNVVLAANIDDRAHVLALQKASEANVSPIVANIYAPNPNTQEKIDFFEKVFEQISNFRFLICPPMFRHQAIWYREALLEVLRKFSPTCARGSRSTAT